MVSCFDSNTLLDLVSLLPKEEVITVDMRVAIAAEKPVCAAVLGLRDRFVDLRSAPERVHVNEVVLFLADCAIVRGDARISDADAAAVASYEAEIKRIFPEAL